MSDGNAGVITIYDCEVTCLSSTVRLEKLCQGQEVKLSSETKEFILYDTLKKIGPNAIQKAVSKLVAKGELTWTEDFEVEEILDYYSEDGENHYLIKWKGWGPAHNSWEPRENLNCEDLIQEFHSRSYWRGAGRKRKHSEPETNNYQLNKRKRIDELFGKLKTCKEIITASKLVTLTSPDKGKRKKYQGVLTCEGLKAPKFTNTHHLLNKKSKAYKKRREEIKQALKEWEKHLNAVSTDPAGIAVENEVDLEGPPENFIYINDYKPGEGIEIPDDPIIGCECTNCVHEKGQCCPAQFGVDFAYYSLKNLRLDVGRPIYECNKRCKCGPECSNRVVQQGRRHKVCVFRTKNGRGWGVKAVQKIKKGTFVMEYVGEVISNEEAEIRGKTYDSVGRTYLFDLDFNSDDCPFTVDAAVYGNVSHFVNHSCDPNLAVYSVWINTVDPRLPRIALFARRTIERGEELTFDYMSSKLHTSFEEGQAESTEASSQQGESMEESATDDEIPIPELTLIDLNDHESDTGSNTESKSEQSDELSTTESEPPDIVTESKSQTAYTEQVTNDAPESESLKSVVKLEPNLPDIVRDVESRAVQVPSSEQNNVNKDLEQMEETVAGTSGVSEQKTYKPSQQKEQYRMVCQCGAKNCRKFVF